MNLPRLKWPIRSAKGGSPADWSWPPELGVRFGDPPKAPVGRLLGSIEADLGLRLPTALAAFLRAFPGGVEFEDCVCIRPAEPSPWQSQDGSLEVDSFLAIDGPNGIRQAIEGVVAEVLPLLLPIADCPGGKFLCYGLADSYQDRIWFWDHEHDGSSSTTRLPGIYLVANSLPELISGLQALPEEETANLAQPISVWFSDDLRELGRDGS
jgi:hypothetical protein